MPRITPTDRFQITWRQPGERYCSGRAAFPRSGMADVLLQVEQLTLLGYEVTLVPPIPVVVDAPQSIIDCRFQS